MAQQLSTITNGTLTVSISNVGATVKSVKSSDGQEFIWQADPAFWAGSAPIVFPICGGLNSDTYRYNGQEYKLGRHGYIRFREFSVFEQKTDEIVFLSKSDKETLECYPFEYELYVRFKLDENKLTTTYCVKNTDKKTMYFSIGAHEGYALDYPLSDYTLEFDTKQDPPVYSDIFTPIDESSVSYTEDGALSLCFDTKQFSTGSMMFHPVCANSVTLKNRHDSKSVAVTLDECEYLIFWTVPNAPFLCIEPWCGNSDPADFSGDISKKPGIIALDASKTHSISHTVTFNN